MIEPYFQTFAEFMAMDGHGPYVWFCFVLAFVLVLGNWLVLRRQRRRFMRDAAGRLARSQERNAQARTHSTATGSH